MLYLSTGWSLSTGQLVSHGVRLPEHDSPEEKQLLNIIQQNSDRNSDRIESVFLYYIMSCLQIFLKFCYLIFVFYAVKKHRVPEILLCDGGTYVVCGTN